MVTSTSSSTSSTSSTTSSSTSNTTASVASEIANTLGAGSGIDTATLVNQLVTSSFAAKESNQTAAEQKNTAQISGIAQASSAISGFSSALQTLINGGTLNTQATSADTSVFTATTKAGARIGNLSTQIEVKQLAQSQSLSSPYLTNSASAVGKGTLTITTGGQSFNVTIDDSNNTLSGLATAINNSNSGVTASIVSDSTGSRLILKGATGAANAFTLAAGAGSDASLSQFTYDPANTTNSMTLAQAAKDALLNVDGVAVTRSSNTISDLIDGVTLSLKSAKVGTPVSLTATQPTAAIAQAVSDFVDTYNQLKATLDSLTAAGTSSTAAGVLRGDVGVRSLQDQLSRLPTLQLATGGSVSTLAEIGVSTQRDGTLTVDTTRLNSILSSDPASVEALFDPTQHSSSPLLKITSAYGTTKPGTYAVTNVVAASGSTSASGQIAGMGAILNSDGTLSASIVSSAAGLTLQALGNVSSATITVDLGLGGALQQISDALTATNGAFANTTASLKTQTSTLSDARTKLTADESSYRDRLNAQFTAMNNQMLQIKATQAYMTQQIAMWTKSS